MDVVCDAIFVQISGKDNQQKYALMSAKDGLRQIRQANIAAMVT